MNVLIVHAHHEPKSFSSALARHTAETLRRLGHSVEISDLYAEHFNPVSG
ncbi:MAG: NAD(P)H-dependent oxidoreductase, partial [Chthoniobacterales bacterium]|nr:NAD(P)H-dependent oxidoreductase [Chthoniobacterales bacterium]